jgi:hypothetical protein
MQRKKPVMLSTLGVALGVSLAISLWIATASSVTAADRFLSVIDDLPLAPNLTEVDGSASVFSKPQGRIVEVLASGKSEMARVLVFYAKALPQLGWKSSGAAIWVREGERLSLDIKESGGDVTVRFSLVPQ